MTPENKRKQVREKIAEWLHYAVMDRQYKFSEALPEIKEYYYDHADELIEKLSSLGVVIKDDDQENLITTNMVHVDEHYEVGDIFIDKDVMRVIPVKE